MVTKVNPPPEDCIVVWESILLERERYLDFYERIKSDWRHAIEKYRDCRGDPIHLAPLDLSLYTDSAQEAEARKGSLIGLYTPKPHKLPYVILERMRRDHGLLHCPSCGESGTPGTLDHYLPKDEFPELSILLLNLVPMCSDCQGIKLTEFCTDKGEKRFFHPYYDDIQTPLFRVEFLPPYTSPSFKILMRHSNDAVLAGLAASHYTGIGLEIRFNRFLKSKYMHLLKLAKKHRVSARNISFGEILSTRLSWEEQEKSINSWDAIFYRSVLEDSQLLAYLEQDALPEKL